MDRSSLIKSAVWLGALALPVAAQAQLIPAVQPIANQSQLSLAETWWQWAINQPIATNALLDTTGANAGVGDLPTVFFLAGTPLTTAITRTITVPAGKPLFTPIINVFGDNTNVPGQPPTTFTPAELLGLISPALEPSAVSNLFLQIDGVSQSDLLSHRLTSDPNNPWSYTVTSHDNLIDGFFGGDTTFGKGTYPSTVLPAVQDGYYIGLQPFSPNSQHTVHFGATNGAGFSQDITYIINTTPEPTTLGLLIVPLAMLARRRRLPNG